MLESFSFSKSSEVSISISPSGNANSATRSQFRKITDFAPAYEIRPRKDHRGVDLISLAFGRLWYGEPNAISNAVDYAKFRSRSYDAVIRVYDEAASVIGTQEHTGDFKEP
jgi:hypothetical protein